MSLPISIDTPKDLIRFLEAPPYPKFLVVYAAVREADGLMWCGDCRRAEPVVGKAFGKAFGGDGEGRVRVVDAGGEGEWRNPDNLYRKSPFLITALPTIIKVTEHAEEGNCCADGQCGIDEDADETVWTRLVEADCYNEEKLEAFLKSGKEDRR